MPIGLNGNLVKSEKFLTLDTDDRWVYVVLGMELSARDLLGHKPNMLEIQKITGLKKEKLDRSIVRLIAAGLIKRHRNKLFLEDEHHFTVIKEKKKETKDKEIYLRIFNYWQRIHNASKAKYTPSRRQKIKARINEGYTEDELRQAIYGCYVSDFHQGQNKQGQKYNQIDLIFRNGEKVEYFIKKYKENKHKEKEREENKKITQSKLREEMLDKHRRNGNVKELELDIEPGDLV